LKGLATALANAPPYAPLVLASCAPRPGDVAGESRARPFFSGGVGDADAALTRPFHCPAQQPEDHLGDEAAAVGADVDDGRFILQPRVVLADELYVRDLAVAGAPVRRCVGPSPVRLDSVDAA